MKAIPALPVKVQKVADEIGSPPIPIPTVQISDERLKKRREWFGDFEFAVAPIITSREGVLLVLGRQDGKWTVPGGFVEIGEDAEEAGVREAKEETGLSIEIVRPLILFKGAVEAPLQGRLDYYLVLQQTRITGGELRPIDTDEVSEARYFSISEMEKIVSRGPFRVAHPSLDPHIAPVLIKTLKNLPSSTTNE